MEYKPNNKTIRTDCCKDLVAIVVKRNGVWKYVAREFYKKFAFQYTVRIDHAKHFASKEGALDFAESQIQEEYQIVTVTMRLDLTSALL